MIRLNSKVYRNYFFYIATLLTGCNSTILSVGSTAITDSITPTPTTMLTPTTMNKISDESLEQNLRDHIEFLSQKIGIRNIGNEVNYQKLCQAVQYIIESFQKIGFQVNTMPYIATYKNQNFEVKNIEVVIPGSIDTPNDRDTKHINSSEYIVIGAHYDTVFESPGADDNGSGIAVLIEIARHLYDVYIKDQTKIKRTIKLVAFPNEECPYSLDDQTGKRFSSNMGSVQYAKQAKARGDRIIGMISLESISYFSNEPKSQIYPWYLKWLKWLYGDQGNFLMLLGDLHSRSWQSQFSACYNKDVNRSKTMMHRMGLPGWFPDIYRSDHGPFALEGIPAVMITNTANLRNPHYHKATDTIDTIDFSLFTQATKSLITSAKHLALGDTLQP